MNKKVFLSILNSFEQYKNNLAIKDSSGEYCYNELNLHSNDIAVQMKEAGLTSNCRVAICMPKTRNFVATVIAIWKCECSYVPIDISFPQERKNFILQDSEARLLVDEQGIHKLYDTASASKDEAYVLYTSGTTGKPKGVPICHRNLSALYYNFDNCMMLKDTSIFLQFTSVTFDISLMDLFYPLTKGATVDILPEDARHDTDLLSQFINKEHITHAYIPPILLSILPHKEYPSLKYIWVGGEAAPEHVLQDWAKKYKVFNLYGPTETTVGITCNNVQVDSEHNDLGLPFIGTLCYVLDENHKILADDVEGELYIGGAQMMKGYVKRPELNAKVFIDNPFVSDEDRKNGVNLKLYKTGDRVIRRSNGHLIYRGRIDNQVKLHGFRIELGEIEHALMNIESVSNAVARIKDGSLVAFVQTEDNKLTNEILRNIVSQKLPYYMIPSKWIVVEKFPMTVNGKIDLTKLSNCHTGRAQTINSESYTYKEKLLSDFASSVVGVPIGVDDDLFLAGMTSMQVIQFVNKAKWSTTSITVSRVFEKKTIRAILADEKPRESFWYNKEENKPIFVMFSGFASYLPSHGHFMPVFAQSYSVYMVETFAEYFYGRDEADGDELLNHYADIVESIANGEEIILGGYCVGADLAIRVAEILTRRHRSWIPPIVLNMEGEFYRVPFTVDNNYPSGSFGWKLRINDMVRDKFQPVDYKGNIINVFCAKASVMQYPELDEQPAVDIEEYKRIIKENVSLWKNHYPQAPFFMIDCEHFEMMFHPYIDEVYQKVIETLDKLK